FQNSIRRGRAKHDPVDVGARAPAVGNLDPELVAGVHIGCRRFGGSRPRCGSTCRPEQNEESQRGRDEETASGNSLHTARWNGAGFNVRVDCFHVEGLAAVRCERYTGRTGPRQTSESYLPRGTRRRSVELLRLLSIVSVGSSGWTCWLPADSLPQRSIWPPSYCESSRWHECGFRLASSADSSRFRMTRAASR